MSAALGGQAVEPAGGARRWARRLLCALAASMAAGAVLAPAAGAQTPSNDASLRSLSIESDIAQTRMFPKFDRDVDRYDVAVPSGETEVTVTVVLNDSGATVELSATRTGGGSNVELEPDSITGSSRF